MPEGGASHKLHSRHGLEDNAAAHGDEKRGRQGDFDNGQRIFEGLSDEPRPSKWVGFVGRKGGGKKNLLTINDLTADEISELVGLTAKIKKDKAAYSGALKGKSIGLIFQKPSNRTRVSFEIGMVQLGGYAIYLGPNEIEMGERESVKDVASVLARYLDGLVARTYSHSDVAALARHADIPVINGLSDR